MNTSPRSPTHLASGEGTALWFLGQIITYKVRDEDDRIAVFELTVGPYGGAPPHLHPAQNETHYVLEGRFRFLWEGQTVSTGPGSVVHVPMGRSHAFMNLGPGSGTMLCITTPAGPLEQFYEEAGEPVTDRDGAPAMTPTMERIQAVATRTGGLQLVLPGENPYGGASDERSGGPLQCGT